MNVNRPWAAQRHLQAEGFNAQASIDLTADPVAGEVPGQSYLNQPGQGADAKADGVERTSLLNVLLGTAQASQAATSAQGSAVRGAACIVTIDAEGEAMGRAREMATALGARSFS